ncbi:hypothetical protein K437DRAFT_273527 [Tilletiaria anomala UBC 951]|uniref:F-box domain-containing protein n=1 Tax=Tilletiaria anomala (strain ATCC 24038 / CBS 436.72 / UBC 951) TaxID=1037660 RepID=A0A066W2M8_TILAU|nr:uncharacterized protein K437DRAFT_273527 [Tilletiaria anomala UBC 951]KDN48227.1 hypothetical protein K437DRAFT_273527 [Tilletiaria anomala UBC 951]
MRLQPVTMASGPAKRSRLLELPREIFLHISSFLPLGSRIVLERQTCAQLRSLGRPSLDPPYRLSLPQLHDAAEEIRGQFGKDGSNSGDASRADKSHLFSLASLSNNDLILLIRALEWLVPQLRVALKDAGHDTDDFKVPPKSRPFLRSIFAVGWHGVPGDRFAQMLAFEPALQHVETVIKTDRLDNDSWYNLQTHLTNSEDEAYRHKYRAVLTADKQHRDSEWRSSSSHRRGRSQVSVEDMPRLPGDLAAALAQVPLLPSMEKGPFFVRTQALVSVGSKRPPFFLKGMGLSAGYDCLCFVNSDLQSGVSPGSPATSMADRSETGNRDTSSTRRPMLKHVILQGRHTLQEARELESMYEWSDTTCIACKQTITF